MHVCVCMCLSGRTVVIAIWSEELCGRYMPRHTQSTTRTLTSSYLYNTISTTVLPPNPFFEYYCAHCRLYKGVSGPGQGLLQLQNNTIKSLIDDIFDEYDFIGVASSFFVVLTSACSRSVYGEVMERNEKSLRQNHATESWGSICVQGCCGAAAMSVSVHRTFRSTISTSFGTFRS
jgi:hypothetical protein